MKKKAEKAHLIPMISSKNSKLGRAAWPKRICYKISTAAITSNLNNYKLLSNS